MNEYDLSKDSNVINVDNLSLQKNVLILRQVVFGDRKLVRVPDEIHSYHCRRFGLIGRRKPIRAETSSYFKFALRKAVPQIRAEKNHVPARKGIWDIRRVKRTRIYHVDPFGKNNPNTKILSYFFFFTKIV